MIFKINIFGKIIFGLPESIISVVGDCPEEPVDKYAKEIFLIESP